MTILAYLLALPPFILGCLLFLRLKWPYSFFYLWPPQIITGAISPFLAASALLGMILGLLHGAPAAAAAGGLGALLQAVYIFRVLAAPADFDRAFGKDWRTRIPPRRESLMLRRRGGLGLPRSKPPRWDRDIPFYTVPGAGRQLLCDVWRPPEGVDPTGLALVFFHGSAWYMFDKDFGTRPFFRHLAAQGHVVMDAAYRLCPEVDLCGMIGDVKRAIAWMKAGAGRYGADRERVVAAGASAGGHLALLAAYAPDHPELTPADAAGADLSVRAVVSFYGPTDLRAVYEYTNQSRLTGLPKVEIGKPPYPDAGRLAGRLDILLGGHLHEAPGIYELASPAAHVHPGCPPTLLIQGDADVITPVDATRELHRKLVEAEVPVVNIVFPNTNHAFDLLLPQVSPPARSALYAVDRFLSLML